MSDFTPRTVDVVPWGMGWTLRIGGAEYTANCPPSEAYARRLFLGLCAVGGPVTALGAAGSSMVGGTIMTTTLLLVLSAIALMAAVLPVVTAGRAFRACVHMLLLCQIAVVYIQIPAFGGLPWGVGSLFWGVFGPLAAVVLLSPSAGFFYWGLLLVVALISLVAPDFPIARRAPLPSETAAAQIAWGAVVSTLCMVILIGWFTELRRIVEAELQREQHRADRLLDDVLPAAVAKRLKQGETQIADSFYEVTVLFADVVGFTPMSAEMSPAESLTLLDDVFSAFDDVCKRHGIEKIRTIGDGYMAVSGAPERRDDHAIAMARAALEMRAWLVESGIPLQVRIGMNSGPAVGGVIGTTRFHYDLWGDAVNVAARMESHGEPGRIQIGPRTRDLLGRGFTCTPRGPVEVKGRGAMDTYWLDG